MRKIWARAAGRKKQRVGGQGPPASGTAFELLLPLAARPAPTPTGLDGPGREVGQSGGSSVLQLPEVSRKGGDPVGQKQQFLAGGWLP